MINSFIHNVLRPVIFVQRIIEFSPIHIFFILPLLVLYFIIARAMFGFHTIFVLLLLAGLIAMRYSLTAITYVFFFLTLIFYCFGPDVEANRYMSFVYGFLILSVLRYTYISFAEQFKKKKR